MNLLFCILDRWREGVTDQIDTGSGEQGYDGSEKTYQDQAHHSAGNAFFCHGAIDVSGGEVENHNSDEIA